LHADPGALGVDGSRIALGGDSVGANLALAAALALREAGESRMLQGLLLNYGAYSDDDESASFHLFDGPRYTLDRNEMRGFWQGYLRDEHDRRHPLAQPLRADLSRLPPSLLVVADNDVLRDGSLQLAAALRACGNATTLRRYAGATHSFLEAMSLASLSVRALDDSAAWLRGLAPRDTA
jgi:acetyl esterase